MNHSPKQHNLNDWCQTKGYELSIKEEFMPELEYKTVFQLLDEMMFEERLRTLSLKTCQGKDELLRKAVALLEIVTDAQQQGNSLLIYKNDQ